MVCEETPGDDVALDALANLLEVNILLYTPASCGRPIHFPAISGRLFGNGYIQIAHLPFLGAYFATKNMSWPDVVAAALNFESEIN